MSSKSRFDGLDCKAMAAYLQKQLTGRRVVNIYNGANGETYIFKLDNNNTNHADGDGKSFLVLESGLRFHTLPEFQAIDSMPSPFCAKLRKHLRGLRLEQVTQLGKSDRVVLFQWGAGSSRHTIILELYAKGNIILTDKDFVVLALLRSHVYQATTTTATTAAPTIKDKDEDGINHTAAPKAANDNVQNNTVAVQVGQVFPVSYAATIETTTTSTSDSAGAHDRNATVEDAAAATAVSLSTAADFNAWAVQHIRQSGSWQKNSATTTSTSKKRASKNKNNCTLKTLLLQNSDSGVSHFGPGLIEHCIRVADCDPNMNLVQRLEQMEKNPAEATRVAIWSDDEWTRLRDALQKEGPSILESLERVREKDGSPGGYILYQPRTAVAAEIMASTSDVLPHADKLLLEFQPVLLRQHEHCPVLPYDTFDQAVQDFFHHLEHQKAMTKAQSAEQAAVTRLDKVRADQEERVRQLEAQQLVWQQQAATVQQHAASVDQALQVVNSALDSGMDWDQLEQVVHVEQTQNRNPIALLIHRLELEHEAMVLRLPTQTTDLAQYFADHSRSTEPTLDVRISLHESAFGNASALFAKYRSSKEKSQKTADASVKALRAAEETARKQLAAAQKRQQHTVSGAVGKRKVLWFEKFHWFVTSDNYLVIAGRDAHQNELLVKRYLRPGDAYLHADVHGAASVILRAKRRRRRNTDSGGTDVLPLSEQALREAGHFTICRSSAWASRMITSAWWVEAHQVSKTAPTGEYLTVGSFMIRGKKQFLPPTPLEMGIGVLFVLGDDNSIRRHANERRDLALLGLDDDDDDDERNAAADENSNFPAEEQNGNHCASRETTRREDAALSDRSRLAADQSDDQRAAIRMGDEDSNDKATVIFTTPEADGLDEMGKGAGEEPTEKNEGSNEDKPKQRKGLSARDRRLIRKHGSLEAAERSLSTNNEESVDEAPINTEATSTTPDTHKPVKRGRKAKQKKMMTKYADQDEEDRKLAMQALQGGEKVNKKPTPGSKRRDAKVSAKQQEVAAETVALLVKDASTVAAKLADVVRQPLAECVTVCNNNGQSQEDGEAIVRWEKLDAETIEQLMSLEPLGAQVAAAKRLLELKQTTRIDNFSSSLGGIIRTIRKHGYKDLGQVADGDKSEVRKSKNEEEDKEVSKWKQTMEAEGAVAYDVDEDAVDDTTELNKLTSKPQPEDLILSAVPICAPYHTLSQYAYRVKLTPGNMKRGKASKQCVDMLLKTTKNAIEGVDRQLDLIKRVGDNDWVQVICGDVKIAAAGASKLVKQNKTKNKQKVKSGK